MTLRWWDREIRLRHIPTPTERQRREAVWWGVAWVAMAAFIAAKIGGLW